MAAHKNFCWPLLASGVVRMGPDRPCDSFGPIFNHCIVMRSSPALAHLICPAFEELLVKIRNIADSETQSTWLKIKASQVDTTRLSSLIGPKKITTECCQIVRRTNVLAETSSQMNRTAFLNPSRPLPGPTMPNKLRQWLSLALAEALVT